ncbi:DUF6924 domain-containing protein [Rhodococcoides yunnanense]|uniref:DUF6924 domain-containing protein n=1 Tax=Rhodococcoides yunnanense TaxID=278209 RepID=UPI0009350973|nr:hypothetical protein [Rhodococcus yunnanensis]
MSRQLPAPNGYGTLMVRTWFGDDDAWRATLEAAQAPSDVSGTESAANLQVVDDETFSGLTVEELAESAGPPPFFVLIADERAILEKDSLILVVENRILDNRSKLRSFRVPPQYLASVENNLSQGNMDFSEFYEETGHGGVFQGFGNYE